MTPPRSRQTPLSPLRAKMLQQMQLHRLAPGTQQLSATAITDFARYYWRSPDQLTPDEIRAYLHHLLEERKLAWSTCNVTAAAIGVPVQSMQKVPISCVRKIKDLE